MKDIDADFLRSSSRTIEERAKTHVPFRAEAAGSVMDRVDVTFDTDGVSNRIARTYASDERQHYFTISRWQSIAPYLLRLKARYPDLRGKTSLWLDDIAGHPGLVFTIDHAGRQLALPDPAFVASDAYADLRSQLSRAWIPWCERRRKLFWRGASTGRRSSARPDWRDLPRMRLCSIAAEHPDRCDVGISDIVQIGDPTERQAIRATGWMKDRVPVIGFMQYRYCIDIDGNANSWPGLFTKLLMGNTVLKVASEQRYAQWYYGALLPWKHYVPVAADMSDLLEKLQWVESNEAEAEQIGAEAGEFARLVSVERTLDDIGPKLSMFLQSCGTAPELAVAASSELPETRQRSPQACCAGRSAPVPVVFAANDRGSDSAPDKGTPTMDAALTIIELSTTSALVGHARRALERAIGGDHKLSDSVLALAGMSGRKYRAFVNNLIEQVATPRYLEVGTLAGSTLCSALYGNEVTAMAIDNWSLFGGPAAELFANLSRFRGNAHVSFLERDFRQINYATLGAFNVYLFDGPHSAQDHYDGVVLAQPALDDCYVQIIDDWNWPHVRSGTMRAITELGLRIDFMAEIRTSLDDQHAIGPSGENSDWHNGYFIGVLSKPGVAAPASAFAA